MHFITFITFTDNEHKKEVWCVILQSDVRARARAVAGTSNYLHSVNSTSSYLLKTPPAAPATVVDARNIFIILKNVTRCAGRRTDAVGIFFFCTSKNPHFYVIYASENK